MAGAVITFQSLGTCNIECRKVQRQPHEYGHDRQPGRNCDLAEKGRNKTATKKQFCERVQKVRDQFALIAVETAEPIPHQSARRR
jgi:hypothetical protein